ncbi:hypothetical protein R3P38DRAFT_2799721 [Favolaschia claudopus]|uniref:Uncharacterized protein n=1 Tax=Favolaschia claudopus TaxID=2862362 RepID=A0AAV9ZZ20_9AGAR
MTIRGNAALTPCSDTRPPALAHAPRLDILESESDGTPSNMRERSQFRRFADRYGFISPRRRRLRGKWRRIRRGGSACAFDARASYVQLRVSAGSQPRRIDHDRDHTRWPRKAVVCLFPGHSPANAWVLVSDEERGRDYDPARCGNCVEEAMEALRTGAKTTNSRPPGDGASDGAGCSVYGREIDRLSERKLYHGRRRKTRDGKAIAIDVDVPCGHASPIPVFAYAYDETSITLYRSAMASSRPAAAERTA